MHGVKRLFAWMIPRFDPARFNVSLISLRTKDTSEDTLEQLGIDVTYLHRGKFDPATLPALVKVLDEKKADIVHMHGYGATTFGRICAAWRKIPAIVHEHANHTTTPWFQQMADTALAPYTDLAIAVSRSTADFVINARKMPAEQDEGRLSRRAARRVRAAAVAGRNRARPAPISACLTARSRSGRSRA